MKRARLAVFASGSGSNYQAIVEACIDGRIDADVVLLVCDKPGAKVLERAEKFGTKAFAFNPKDYESREAYETMLATMLSSDAETLRLTTSECMAYLAYLRRFAKKEE